MSIVLKTIWVSLVFLFLTVLTQVGGIAFLLSRFLNRKINIRSKRLSFILFLSIYFLFTFIIVPILAPLSGREKVKNTVGVKPASYLTVILNRNYVSPEMNSLLNNVENDLNGTGIQIRYLDANFPFINGFPLLPHLSHNDGKKLDLSLLYENSKGEITNKQKSMSGYGVFAEPNENEFNQIERCIEQGYFQYSYPKYLTFGRKNERLEFSEKGTKKLIQAILNEHSLGKIFIEPHLKERLGLANSKVRFHGCRAVRHDDHIHIQLK